MPRGLFFALFVCVGGWVFVCDVSSQVFLIVPFDSTAFGKNHTEFFVAQKDIQGTQTQYHKIKWAIVTQ